MPPTSLEEWTTFRHDMSNVPWTLREQEYFSIMATFAHKLMRHGRDRTRFKRNKVKGSLLYAYVAITRARYRHGYFNFPIEQHLMGKIAKRVIAARHPEGQNTGMLI